MRLLPLICAVLLGCGGSDPGPIVDRYTLTWTPSERYTDNSFMGPPDLYEGFVAFDGIFTDNLDPVFSVAGADNGVPVQSFDLRNLAPFGIVPPAYLSLRCVKDNVQSAFAESVLWEE